jgi:hypothetical protein
MGQISIIFFMRNRNRIVFSMKQICDMKVKFCTNEVIESEGLGHHTYWEQFFLFYPMQNSFV